LLCGEAGEVIAVDLDQTSFNFAVGVKAGEPKWWGCKQAILAIATEIIMATSHSLH
jgi:hypothetical protein